MEELERCKNSLNLTRFSALTSVAGRLPLEIGNITELKSLDIQNSDLSAGLVPESIGRCIKLIYVKLRSCNLQQQFPTGLKTLESLGMYIMCN
jgi:hypothetical protein